MRSIEELHKILTWTVIGSLCSSKRYYKKQENTYGRKWEIKKKNNFQKPVDSRHDETTMPKPEKSKHLQKKSFFYKIKH
jgi:hypothetical protein